ncbi:MAG: hypothetical protein Aurels2KO_55420 [Aureliella sp.]
MITGITIENFKGIGKRIEIPIRPITLLFGANSSGKSTVLHAIHYLNEVFQRHNLDADQTQSGGGFVDLGGFKNFVHSHETDRTIRLSVSAGIGEEGLPDYTTPLGEVYEQVYGHEVMPQELFEGVDTVTITIAISHSRRLFAPVVERYSVSINDEWMADISTDSGRPFNTLTVNPLHSSLTPFAEFTREMDFEMPWNEKFTDAAPALLALLARVYDLGVLDGITTYDESNLEDGPETPTPRFDIQIPRKDDALPNFEQPLELNLNHSNEFFDGDRGLFDIFSHTLEGTLSQLVLGPGKVVTNLLKTFRYLGPLRETPVRNFQPPRYPQPSRWASGLGAWDALQTGPDNLVMDAGHWLGDPEKLDAGCTIERRRYFELDFSNPIIRKLADGRAFDEVGPEETLDLSSLPVVTKTVVIPAGKDIELRPHDVGVGISQIVPVILSALDGERVLVAIEQPELHIHPRLQAELGDLFVESATGKRQQTFLLETHSEHLILRLLRRIRETFDGELPADKMPLTPSDVAVYYVHQGDAGTEVTHLPVDETGEFMSNWPDGFFEERAKELF